MLFKPESNEAGTATEAGRKLPRRAARRRIGIAAGHRADPRRARLDRLVCVPDRSRAAGRPRRRGPTWRCRCWRRRRRIAGRAGLSRRRRLGAGAEQRHGARPGRRQADRGEFQRRPGRQGRRRARRDRSGDLSGAIRSGGGEEGAGRGPARQRARSISRAISSSPPPMPAPSSRPTPRRRPWRSSRRRCAPTRPRSTTPRRRSSYTKVVAPISGRAGLRQVDQGNLVRAGDTTGLVVITQLQPIAVQFSLPQQQIVRVNAAAAQGRADGRRVRQ